MNGQFTLRARTTGAWFGRLSTRDTRPSLSPSPNPREIRVRTRTVEVSSSWCSRVGTSCRRVVVVESFWRSRRTELDNLNRYFVPSQLPDPRESRDSKSDSRDKMSSFCPVESSFGHNGIHRSRSQPMSCRAFRESARGQNAKIPERQGHVPQSVHRADRQKDRMQCGPQTSRRAKQHPAHLTGSRRRRAIDYSPAAPAASAACRSPSSRSRSKRADGSLFTSLNL